MAERERERERERFSICTHFILYLSLLGIKSILLRKVGSQTDQRISGAHLSKFSRICFSRFRFPESQSLQMPTGKAVIRLCGSSFARRCRKVSLMGRQYSGMRPLIMITSFLMSRVCQIWVIFCVDSKAVFWE